MARRNLDQVRVGHYLPRKLLAALDAEAERRGMQRSTLIRLVLSEAVDKLPPRGCTGIAATWCPQCGNCKCGVAENGERTLDDEACPLHARASLHAERADDSFDSNKGDTK